MTTFLDKLNLQPQERRWVVGIGVAVLLVLNYALIWPYFSEMSQVRDQMDKARGTIDRNTREIELDKTTYKPQLEKLGKTGPSIQLDAGDIQLQKAIMAQTSPGFMPNSYTPVVNKSINQTNEFFEEQSMRITVDCEEKPLVDFLYKIGGDNSMIRVRDLRVRPSDQNRYKLNANVTLSASYQKKVEAKAPAAPTPSKPGLTKPGMAKPSTPPATKPAIQPPGPKR